MDKNKINASIFLSSMLVALTPSAASAMSAYTVTPIQLPDSSELTVFSAAINNSNVVVVWAGSSNGSTFQSSYTWQTGSTQEVSTSVGIYTTSYAINDSGNVVGTKYNTANGDSQGYIWNSNQGFVYPSVLGTDSSIIFGINNQNQAVGVVENTINSAFVWDQTTGATILPSFGTGDSQAKAINDSGQIVGTSGNSLFTAYPIDLNSSIGLEHAVLWQNGTVVDLTPNTAWSKAEDINNIGQVVGYRMRTVSNGDGVSPNFLLTPFIWDSVHGEVDLPLAGDQSTAVAINDIGEIVGHSGSGDADARALLWENGVVYDLNTFLDPNSGWLLQYATDINNAGEIVGTGIYDGQSSAFVLTPSGVSFVPEPALFGVLMLGLFPLRRHRRG